MIILETMGQSIRSLLSPLPTVLDSFFGMVRHSDQKKVGVESIYLTYLYRPQSNIPKNPEQEQEAGPQAETLLTYMFSMACSSTFST